MNQSTHLRSRSSELLEEARRLRRRSEQLLLHREQVRTRVKLAVRRPSMAGATPEDEAPSHPAPTGS